MAKSLSIPITESNQVGEARRLAARLGTEAGLDETGLGNLGIVVTELGSNLYKHAKRGELIFRISTSDSRRGIEVISLDRGPGIAEIARCMEDGYSTSGTKGNGLGSIKRLSTVFDIYSTTAGTAIVSQFWAKSSSGDIPALEIGAICLPYPGERLCGDAWASASKGSTQAIVIADGLGHGVDAAAASDQAIVVFGENPELSPQILLQRMDGALRSTRGAAVLNLQFKLQERKIICSGIGNISGGTVKGETSKSFVSMNGIVGHQTHRFNEFVYDWAPGSLLVVHSDGLQTKWRLANYPGLQMRHPSLIAAVLFRDFRRERDDVTVLVARENSRAAS